MKEIASGIRYIGVDDLDLDLFESQYIIPEGMSYNSFLILDEKVAVLDTVDSRTSDQWLEGLQEALQGRKPDYLIWSRTTPVLSAFLQGCTLTSLLWQPQWP